MELLRELLKLQHERGCLDEAVLRELSERDNVPLHRLEEVVSFYPHLRRPPPQGRTVEVRRAVVRAMADCPAWQARLAARPATFPQVDFVDHVIEKEGELIDGICLECHDAHDPTE